MIIAETKGDEPPIIPHNDIWRKDDRIKKRGDNVKKLVKLMLAVAMLAAITSCYHEPADQTGMAEVTFFDVGKADAIIITVTTADRPSRSVIMIDTGTAKTASQLAEKIKKMGIEIIDTLIITHFDKDHVGGAAEIIDSFTVDQVLQSNYPKDSDAYHAYLQALECKGLKAVTVSGSEMEIRAMDAVFHVYPPAQAEYPEDPSNNSSLITVMELGGTSVMFMGDAENLRIEEFIQQEHPVTGNIIMKMPHHGNYHKELKMLVGMYSPKAAVLTCSEKEPEDEEKQKTINLLTGSGSSIYLTSDGDLKLTIDEKGYRFDR